MINLLDYILLLSVIGGAKEHFVIAKAGLVPNIFYEDCEE